MTQLADRAAQARRWMLEEAFPLWAEVGPHPAGGFRERIDLAGKPIDDATSRVRLQARQTFCFAYARALGWDRQMADAMIERGVDALARHCRRPDGVFGKQVKLGSGLCDERADLYDTAFALLGLTTAAQTGHGQAKVHAARLNRAIDTALLRPDGQGGYFEELPDAGVRLQNPHMHLFEASLAYYAFTKDSAALARADHVLDLIERRFYDNATGRLHETRTLSWGPQPSDRFEAGHQFEWVWLLDTYARITKQPLPTMARPLYEAGLAMTDESGRIALSHALDGTVGQAIYRTWSQTEALKAHVAAYARGWVDEGPAVACFDLLWQDHIAPAPSGAWIDRVDGDGRPAASDITAATGYHLFLAFDDVMRVSGK